MPEYGLPLKFRNEKLTGKLRSVEYRRDRTEFYTGKDEVGNWPVSSMDV